jgi:lactoylglutathione lyase
MKLEVGAIGIYVKDMKQIVEFYRDAMGFNIDWDGGSFAGVKMFNGVFFNLCERNSSSKFSYTTGLNVTFQISCNVEGAADVDREYKKNK